MSVLHLFPAPNRLRHSRRWGWLLVFLVLIAAAGYFLYPSMESFTAPTRKAIVEVQEPSYPPAMPVERPAPVEAPKPKPAPPPHRPAATSTAKLVRQIAPSAPEGIRNRITG